MLRPRSCHYGLSEYLGCDASIQVSLRSEPTHIRLRYENGRPRKIQLVRCSQNAPLSPTCPSSHPSVRKMHPSSDALLPPVTTNAPPLRVPRHTRQTPNSPPQPDRALAGEPAEIGTRWDDESSGGEGCDLVRTCCGDEMSWLSTRTMENRGIFKLKLV